ncbi:MAG: hypothetical protein KDN22_11800 [Verrucomicrobiae bacterium]|nr:hypothetical protein [Verrucomicrobiae bacterium]
MRKSIVLLSAIGLVTAIVLFSIRPAPHETPQEPGAGVTVKEETVSDAEQAAPANLLIPDLSGVWRLADDDRGTNAETVLSAGGNFVSGQAKPAKIRLAADSGLGQAIKSVRYAFNVEGNTLERVRLTGNNRRTEAVFKVIATQGSSVRMEDSETTAPAMLTLKQDGKINLQFRQASGAGATQIFVREG